MPARSPAARFIRAALGVFAVGAFLALLLLTIVDSVSAATGGGGRGGGGVSRGGGGGFGAFSNSRGGGGGRSMGGRSFGGRSFGGRSMGSRSMGGRSMGGRSMGSRSSAGRRGRSTYGSRTSRRTSGRTSRSARSTRTTSPSRMTRYPSRPNRLGGRTPMRTATGGTKTTPTRPPGRYPQSPQKCYGRGCGSQATNNPPYQPPSRPPAGCRDGYCGPTKPPQSNPPRRPPYYPPPSAGGGGAPPYYPPVPPYSTASGPPSAGGGGGGAPPRRAGGGGGGGGGGPSRVARLPAYNAPPPTGEGRYVPDQVICVLRDDLTEAQIDEFLADNNMTRTGNGGDYRIGLLGVRVFRFRITDGRPVTQVMAVLAQDPRGVSVQPNYVYQLSEMPQLRQQVAPRYRTQSGTPGRTGNYSMQYVIAKLQLLRAHQVTRGERVLIAVIDSGVDVNHPELVGQVLRSIDVTEDQDQSPHSHGTAMAGAIGSRGMLLGVAPGASILAIRAFSPRSQTSGSGTSMHIAMAIDRATVEGARIINMSLAGPHDPMVQKAVEEARARGIVLIAAAGNNGPKAPPAYPAAYPQVIAVTATDSNDQVYSGANRGRYIAVAAPGVEVIVAAPNRAYAPTTGTSVAAAHISGIVALMLARNPMLDPDMVRDMLLRSVRNANGDPTYGAGYADAYAAVTIVDPDRVVVPVAGGESLPVQ